MKNSNSRDKNMRTQIQPQPPSNKLMRTDIHQPRNQQLERTSNNYNRQTSGRKLDSTKSITQSTKVVKKQYIVQDNMTESRIHQAKMGLQLLKKKMGAKGMSREKLGGTSNDIGYSNKNITSLKGIGSQKGQEQQYENRNTNMPPKNTNARQASENQIYSKKPQPSIKNINDSKPTPKNQRKQPPQPAYYERQDQVMEAPIKPKKDFNAMLEEELRKQKMTQQTLTQNRAQKYSNNNELSEYPDENIQLIQCRHCDRKFNQKAIDKHESKCLTVFQQKRKAFDAASQRAPEVQGFQAPNLNKTKQQPGKVQQKTSAQQSKVGAKKQEQIPAWKAQSLAFRASLKQAAGKQLTKQEKAASDTAAGNVACNYCGRKFNQKAAERHIPFCETKSKQMPKMNMKKK